MILDFALGKMFSKPPRGGLNVVPVEDVARAHVAALGCGRPGERYILGGENLSLDDVWEMLSEATGKPLPRFRAPHALALAMAYADEGAVPGSARRDARGSAGVATGAPR